MSEPMPELSVMMSSLSERRPIFHSEADFQHALAWELQTKFPSASIHLERPQRTEARTIYLDILMKLEGHALAVELKYKTQKYHSNATSDEFRLSHQSASDIGRYDFIKDISRLEQVTQSIPNCRGWAIFLTNDSKYWNMQKRIDTVDAAFSIAEGKTIEGSRGWGALASAGTMKNRELPLVLNGSYVVAWNEYSNVETDKHGRFQYLGFEVS